MLSDAFLAKLDALALRMRHAATGGSGGLRRSRALGSSVEFSDFREYAPGDDIRRVDWNAFARFDRLFLKLFMEEKQQRVNLIVDASASMGLFKWDAVLQLCQTLGYLCLCGGDSVATYVLTGSGVGRLRLLSGRQRYPEFAQFLQQVTPGGEVKLDAAIPRLSLPDGRGMTLLISDLLSEDGYEKALQSLVYRKQETNVIQLWSREEWEPQLEGALELTDSETGQRRAMTMSYETLKRYSDTARDYVRQAERFCHAHGITHSFIVPEAPFEEQMLLALSRAGLIA